MANFKCKSCGWEGHPSFDLTGSGKLAAKCGAQGCEYIDIEVSPKSLNPDSFERVSASPNIPKSKPSTTPSANLDVESLIKQRFEQLELEIARLEGLKVEHKKLKRLLGALTK